MKAKTISNNDIKNDLLKLLCDAKFAIIFLMIFNIFLVVSDVLLIMFPHIINPNAGLFGRIFMIFVATVLFILFSIFLFKYFRNIYLVKHDRFIVDTEKLYHKSIEVITYYKSSRLKNVLYFKSGRIFVDELTYKSARINDEFYLVMLNDKKLSYVYNKKQYTLNLQK